MQSHVSRPSVPLFHLLRVRWQRAGVTGPGEPPGHQFGRVTSGLPASGGHCVIGNKDIGGQGATGTHPLESPFQHPSDGTQIHSALGFPRSFSIFELVPSQCPALSPSPNLLGECRDEGASGHAAGWPLLGESHGLSVLAMWDNYSVVQLPD